MSEIDDRLAQARGEGYSWDEINGYLSSKREEARKEGYSDREIDQYLGFNGDQGMNDRLTAGARANLSAQTKNSSMDTLEGKPEVSTYMDALVHGLQSSSGGVLARGKAPEQEMPADPGRMMRLAEQAGIVIGDIPMMTIGAVVGAAAGTPEAPGIGTVMAGGAGMFALPELVKREYVDALNYGEVKNAWDFAEKQVGVWWNVAKQAVVGALTTGTGSVVGAGAKVMGMGLLSRTAATGAAELTTMTTAAAALEGRLPTREEFIDGAVLIAGVHVAAGGAHIAERSLGAITENLQKHWVATGERPMETLYRAMTDPAFRLSIVSPSPADAPPGSSRTDAGIYGDFVVARDVDPPQTTGRELPPGVTFTAAAPKEDANNTSIEQRAELRGPDGEVIHDALMTQIDEKLWDVDDFNQGDAKQIHGMMEGGRVNQQAESVWADPKSLDILRERVMQGTKIEDIARELGVSSNAVALKMSQQLIRSRIKSPVGSRDPRLDLKIIAGRAQGKSAAVIAKELSESEGRRITTAVVDGRIKSMKRRGDISKEGRKEPGLPDIQTGKGEEQGDPEYERMLEKYQLDRGAYGIMGGKESDLVPEFFANMADYAQSKGGRLMTGLKGDGLSTETLDKLDAAGLLEEVKTGRGVIYQIFGTKPLKGEGVHPVEGNSPSLGMPHSVAAQTGDANVDAVLNRPKVKEAIDNPKIDRTKDVPDWAGASGPADDLRTHVDRHIPRQVMLNGVTFDPAVPLNIHEQVERSKMEELIPEFMKPGEDGTPGLTKEQAEKEAYKIAHNDYATKAEHSWLRSHNIPVDQYEALFDEWGKSINSYDPQNLPDDLYMVNKHGPADLGLQGIVARGQPTGEAGAEGIPSAASVKPRSLSAMNQIAAANPWTGTTEQARQAVLARMGDRPSPSMWERVQRGWFEFYRQMFNPQHPVNIMTEAIRQGGGLTDFNNPNMLYRMAELSPDNAMYAIQRSMIDLAGNVTGPGLNGILDRNLTTRDWENFAAYGISRWAIEKAQQGKETGVDLAAAHQIVDQERAGGVVVPGIDPRMLARALGVTINDVGPGHPEWPAVQMFGPHYDSARRVVNMLPPGHALYRTIGGASMDYDVVLAHEMGHALADRLGLLAGPRVTGRWWTPERWEALRQELTLHSRRYKPDWWQNKVPAAAGQQQHIRTPGELMADAMATWMTEPGARARMPVLQQMMEHAGVFDDLTNLAGAVPEELGTPISRMFEDLVDWQNGTLDWLRDGGLINTEQLIKMKAENTARIPGYREPQVQQREGRVKGPGPGMQAFDSIKAFFGSNSRIENIEKSLLQDAFLRMSLARRNIANRLTADGLEQIGMAGRVREPARKITLTDKELSDILNASTADPQVRSALSTPGNVDIWRVMGRAARPNEALIFRDGKIEKWEFADPDFTRYVKGLDEGTRSVLITMVSKMAKALRAGVVLNPAFPVRLLSYDVPWQFIVKPGFRNVLQTAYLGLRHTFTQSPLWDQWMRSGFAERIFDGATKNQYIADILNDRRSDPSRLDGVMNNAISPYHWLRWWAQSLSQVMRVGRYVQGVQQGELPMRAAAASSDFAFHRAGFGGPVGKGINSAMPFFAAYLNSLEQSFRSQFGIGRTITGERYNPVHFTAKALGLITLPMLYQYFAYKDEEWYKAQPDWQKDNGLFLHWGEGADAHTMFFRLPPLLGYFYGGLPRRMIASFQSENPGAELSKAWEGAIFTLLPGSFMWTALAPIVEKITNHSFFRDQPLVPDDVKKNFAPFEQFNHYSTETAKGLSRFLSDVPILRDLKLSPPEIDNFIQGWSGTMGDAGVRMAENLLRQTGYLKDDKPAMHFPEDYPLWRSWFSRYPSASAQPIKDFFDRMSEYEQIHGSLVRELNANNLAGFNKVLQEHPQLGAFHSFKLRGSRAMEAAQVPDVDRFRDSLNTAQAGRDRDAANKVLAADRALKKMRQFAITVENVATGSDLSSEVSTLREQGVNIRPSGARISANDKRQILDQMYSWMQVTAEDALKRMDKAGMR